MDIDNNTIISKQCFKCDVPLLESLNVVYNASNTMIILWNKYQILVYDNFEFESAAKIFVPEFQIHSLVISNNYIVCLDCSSNIHITSLKFKNIAQKRFKTIFQPREQGIEKCIQYDEDHTLSLKLKSCTFFLCLHKINSVFQLEKETILINSKEYWPQQQTKEKYVLTSHIITEQHLPYIKHVFNMKENCNDCNIVIISFDKQTVYGCLFSPQMTDHEIVLVKLYSCPVEICNIEIIEIDDLYIVIGLTVGTIIRLALKDMSKTPQLIHLNTALYRCMTKNDTLIYTDGVSMWKTENAFSECDIKFSQFFVKHVKDFVKCGDQIVCTSFTNVIYIFRIDDDKSYLLPETIDEYCSAEKILNNSECLNRIFEEIEKNNELVKKLKQEENHITALSLSNRQDIMNNIIHCNVTVYENYENALKENPELILTEGITEYFKTDTFFFSVNIIVSTIQHFNNIISNFFGDLKIHVTLSSEGKVLKITSIKVSEQLKKGNFLIPFITKETLKMSQIEVIIKIVSNVPGVFDDKQTVWTVLYRKKVVLNSEHFIKNNTVSNMYCLKEPKEPLEVLIIKSVSNQYGDLFQFTDIHKTVAMNWSFYVKLTNNYEEILKNGEYCKQHFNTWKANFLIQQYSSEEFLKSKSSITFAIGNNKINVEIANDGISSPILRVTSENIQFASNIRNFFADMIYQGFINYEPGKEFVNHTVYTVAENLQKSLKEFIAGSVPLEAFPPLLERFERTIIGALPL